MPRPQLDRRVYERAERFRIQARQDLVRGTVDRIWWLANGEGFAYQTSGEHGLECQLVTPGQGSIQAIDQDALAELDLLPEDANRPFSASHRDLILRSLRGDLYLEDRRGPTFVRLTNDGSARNRNGALMETTSDDIEEAPAVAVWSKDGRYALSQRLDYRAVRSTPITQAFPADGGSPIVHEIIDPFPGDAHIPHAHLILIDSELQTCIPVNMPSLAVTHSSPFLRGDCWWDEPSQSFWVLRSARDWLRLQLWQVDPVTGEAVQRFEERAERRIRPSQLFHQRPNVRLVHDCDGQVDRIIWFSEASGWGHLSLVDLETGRIRCQITSVEYVVQQILRFEEDTESLMLAVSGLIEEDPYRWSIVRANLNGDPFSKVVDDRLDHRPLLSPVATTPFFLDIASTVDRPPTATVRDWSGRELVALPPVDISRLQGIGWQPPERFKATGADGKTAIYGTLFLPPEFDPMHSYPVLDHLYPGPQVNRSVPYFGADEIEPLVALGIVGVTIDGRGTPGRSRSFHDVSYGNLGAASGIDDHVAAIQELARTRPWMDLDRVAAFGHSAGGFAVTRALELFPEFYTVGVSQAGRHDGRLVMAMILEAYDDPYDAESWGRASGVEDAARIQAKLLLIHGEMDRHITVHNTMRLVDQLIEANRDFDLLVVPGDDHVFTRRGRYVERRCWDFLVRHLLDLEPPGKFDIRE